MLYADICAGISAATVAWKPLGWRAAFYAEIDRFPSAVLAHHYPETPNLGDMTSFEDWPDADLDVLIGGTPCQGFSVAGLRKGLDDPRSNLALCFGRIAERYQPRWIVWENVPGVRSSDGGKDLGSFLRGLAELGYGLAWRSLDAQFAGLAQRRERLFVVGHFGDWRPAAAVLFEPEGLRWDSAPRREAGQRVAPTIAGRTLGGGGLGTDFDCDGGLIASTGDVAHCLNAGGMGRIDYETETLVSTAIAQPLLAKANSSHRADAETYVAHSLRADGFDASEDGTGRGTPIVPIAFDTTQITSKANHSQPQAGDPCHPLAAGAHALAIAFDCKAGGNTSFSVGDLPGSLRGDGHGGGHAAITFTCKDHGQDAGALSPTLRAMTHRHSTPNAGGQVAIAQPYTLAIRGRDDGHNLEYRQDGTANAVLTPNGGRAGIGVGAVATGWAVRRLTPRECERLQGFPDDYAAIPYRGKIAADGPRYKALGNSIAVPCLRWIGERIELCESAMGELREAA